MTYITAHLPKLEDLKKQLKENPNKIKTYMKYMGFEGSSESIEYLDKEIKEYIQSKSKN